MILTLQRSRTLIIACLASALAVVAARPIAARPAAQDSSLERFQYTKVVMGVEATITLYAPGEPAARDAAAAGFARMEALQRVLSDYQADSEINQVLATAAERGVEDPIAISGDLHAALEASLVMSEISGGAFDVTIGPLVRLWRAARREAPPRLPDAESLAAARAQVGHELVTLEDGAVRLARPDMKLDFGGIGKGLAAHEAVKAIGEAGAPVCLVDLGGDIAAGEAPPGSGGWRVELHPGRGEDVRVSLEGWSAATSGDTEQSIEIDGVRYSHLVDPRTGVGLTSQVSVVVLARDGAIADALASAVSVLGQQEGLALVERLPESEAMVRQTRRGGLVYEWKSSGFARAGGLAAEIEHPPRGFAPMFGGRDLGGWKGFAGDAPKRWALDEPDRRAQQRDADERMRAHWNVVDGALHFDGSDEGENLVSGLMFGDFEFICDWKLAPATPPAPPGDSGIYLRGVPQVQIWDNAVGSGGLYNNQKHPSQPRVVADNPVGQWNRFFIRMTGERVSVWLNGRLVVDDVPLENYWDRGAPLPERGEIELQAHGSPLWFRNIFVRELDEQSAPREP